ncbi:hypothetical protein [Roseibium alexandrii]|uniref:Uncharacterized protein n=1 Tax=Roseibium alexandrii (strain DSM 17067 / NCIMB 14079 / DFL-11) TaxID=244592 RepID=A0A5E8GTK1_ROSAD|nr:hypothetical protein [Roseibium alexandrii]EEE42843.1 hypothetical protein SADFL11_PLAS15 [Roseibium alexandrii DFL-11]
MEFKPNQREGAVNRVRSNLLHRRGPEVGQRTSGTGETVGAWYTSETNVGEALDNGAINDFSERKEAGFNPFTYYKNNQEQYQDIEPLLLNGYFDDVYSPERFEDKVSRARQDLEKQRIIQNGNTLGTVLGVASTLADVDLLTVIPFLGQFKKGEKALKSALKAGTAVAASSALTEGYLYSQQATRTPSDVFMGIATGGLLGGGIGAGSNKLARMGTALSKDPERAEKMFSGDPEPVIVSQNLGETVEESEKIIVKEDGEVEVAEGRRPTAIKVEAGQIEDMDSDDVVTITIDPEDAPNQPLGQGPRPAGLSADAPVEDLEDQATAVGGVNWFARATPLGRIFRMSNPNARGLFMKIVNKGGTITKNHLRGEADVMSAEDALGQFLEDTQIDVMNTLETEYRKTLIDIGLVDGDNKTSQFLGDLKADFGSAAENITGSSRFQHEMSPQEFHQLTVYQMHGMINDADRAGLVERFGEENADKILSRVETVSGKFDEVNQKIVDDMIATGMITPDQIEGEYGMPQLWVYDNIVRDLNEFKADFMERLEGEIPDEFITDNYPGMTRAEFDSDPAFKERVTTEYTDLKYFDRLDAAEERVRLAEDSVKTTKDTLKGDIADLGTDVKGRKIARRQGGIEKLAQKATTALRNWNMKSINQAARLSVNMAELQRAEVSLIKAEQNALTTAAEAARTMTLERLSLETDAPVTIRKAEEGVTEAEQRLFAHISGRMNEVRNADRAKGRWADSDFQSSFSYDETYQKLVSDLATAEARLHRSMASQPKVKETPRLARIEERARQRELELKTANKEFERLSIRVDRIQTKLDNIEANRAKVKDLKANAEIARKDLRDRLKEQGKELKSAKSAYKKMIKGKTARERVDEMVKALAKSPRTPWGGMPSELMESGRQKSRTIKLTAEEKRRMMEKGWLDTDLMSIYDRYFRDVGSRVALRKTVGTDNVEEMWDPIRADYENRIATAEQSGDKKEAGKLRSEMDQGRKDLEAMVGRLSGHYDMPDNPDSVWVYASRNFRRWSLLRFGGLFVTSSFTDLAQIYFTTGKRPFSKEFTKAAKAWRTTLKDMDKAQLRTIITASEFMLLRSRTHALYDIHEGGRGGIGKQGSKTHKITQGIDSTTRYMADKLSVVNLMAGWNATTKGIASIMQLQELNKAVKNWDKSPGQGGLSDIDKARFTALGLGDYEAQLLRKYFDIDGQLEDDVFLPDFEQWGKNSVDLQAQQVLRRIMRNTQDRAVITPGIADRPLVMSTELGRFLLQFQSFGFAAANRVIQPMYQARHVDPSDTRFAWAAAQMVALGFAITVLRAALYGKDPFERDAKDLMYEAIDRSGLASWMSPYADMGLKMFGSSVNDALGMDVLPGASSRFIRNQWWESLLGPSVSTFEDAGGMAMAFADGDTEKGFEKLRSLLPLQQLIRVGENLLIE